MDKQSHYVKVFIILIIKLFIKKIIPGVTIFRSR